MSHRGFDYALLCVSVSCGWGWVGGCQMGSMEYNVYYIVYISNTSSFGVHCVPWFILEIHSTQPTIHLYYIRRVCNTRPMHYILSRIHILARCSRYGSFDEKLWNFPLFLFYVLAGWLHWCEAPRRNCAFSGVGVSGCNDFVPYAYITKHPIHEFTIHNQYKIVCNLLHVLFLIGTWIDVFCFNKYALWLPSHVVIIGDTRMVCPHVVRVWHMASWQVVIFQRFAQL